MAITKTTLAGAIDANAVNIQVTSATGFAAGNFIKIDDEFALVDRSYPGTGTNVSIFRRGDRGSVAAPHNALAIVATGLVSDLAGWAPGNVTQDTQSSLGEDLVTYSVNGAIAIPTRNTMVVLDKATASAMTLGAPAADQDGLRLFITSTTAAAHVITATSLLADAVSGSPHSTITFAAFKGASITLVALAGLWQVQAAVVAPIT